MFIELISDEESTSAQARAYAEYRIFATLARHSRRIRSVKVVVRPAQGSEAADLVTCVVNVTLEHSESVRTRASGHHAYGAIDHAAKRIGALMNRRLSQAP